jgi:hypothetical protein
MKGHNIIKEKNNGIITREFDIANCVNNEQVIKNNIEARCQVIRGELLYNVLLGVPLHVDKDDLDLSIANIILNTYGVKAIEKFTSSLLNRNYKAVLKITTIYNTQVDLEVG